jgi:hypothetical protein
VHNWRIFIFEILLDEMSLVGNLLLIYLLVKKIALVTWLPEYLREILFITGSWNYIFRLFFNVFWHDHWTKLFAHSDLVLNRHFVLGKLIT